MHQTITQLLKTAENKIDIHEAEILLAHTLGKTREYIIAHSDDKVSFWETLLYKKTIKKRVTGMSVAYILGYKEFFGLNFKVNKHTLVPRPDTEIMVEKVLENIDKADVLIDVGTGSGCIPISILKTSNKNIKTFATDISTKALKVAKENARKHNVDITFLHGNLLGPILSLKHLNIKTFKHLIITANLPYLTELQFKKEQSIQHEPKSALIAADNGLYLYKKLLNQIQQLLVTDYKLQVTCFFEIDPSQAKKITGYIKNILPNASVEIEKDLTNCDRIVKVTY